MKKKPEAFFTFISVKKRDYEKSTRSDKIKQEGVK